MRIPPHDRKTDILPDGTRWVFDDELGWILEDENYTHPSFYWEAYDE